MVVMSTERTAARFKQLTISVDKAAVAADTAASTTSLTGNCQSQRLATDTVDESHGPVCCDEDNPNYLVYRKMETIVRRMQNESDGVSVRTVKSFMSKVPSVFTGTDLVAWVLKNTDVDDQAESLHLSHQMAAHGYIFPVGDHILTVKNDNTYYRFQTPYFWPSKSWEPENTDYAVYLCKRTMQNKARLELADYEAENLGRLQKIFSRKWEFIFMQAEAQSKVDKKRDKLERKILDSQERAFWDVHRPVPHCVNTTEMDIKKACRNKHRNLAVPVPAECGHLVTAPLSHTSHTTSQHQDSEGCICEPVAALTASLDAIRTKLERCTLRLSKVAETLISHCEQYEEYDPLLSATSSNPWLTDSTELWDQDKSSRDISPKRVKRWAFSLHELLQDPVGRQQFVRFLDKEFSGENLKFYLALQDLRNVQQSAVKQRVEEIWSEFLAPDASVPVNIDSRSYDIVKKNLDTPTRWTFEAAGAHLFHLMKSDSCSRYLRSEMYREFLAGAKKKVSVRGIRSIVGFSSKKEQNS